MSDQLTQLKSKVREAHTLIQTGTESQARKAFNVAQKLFGELIGNEDAFEDVQELWYGAYGELEDFFSGYGIKKSGK